MFSWSPHPQKVGVSTAAGETDFTTAPCTYVRGLGYGTPNTEIYRRILIALTSKGQMEPDALTDTEAAACGRINKIFGGLRGYEQGNETLALYVTRRPYYAIELITCCTQIMSVPKPNPSSYEDLIL
ncbi:hypothetical protein TWF481_008816 [Arthrobotrys musiformis]|uniref:Uncharacterized protein n=1 Tax=Arthrobotrys musiformis TaxID=47236 RepID=A0AAV9W989_9PEZI